MKEIAILRNSKVVALAVACMLLRSLSVFASEMDVRGLDIQSSFSPGFFGELDEANRSKEPVVQLKALYQKYTKSQEQAEIELTLARVLCQRTGYVNPVEAIKWYNKALVRELPAATLAKEFILRGNMHERLDHDEQALADYVRGMLICLQFNLPDTWPNRDAPGKLQPSTHRNWPRPPGEAEPTEEQLFEQRQQNVDYWRNRNMIEQEHNLLQSRYFYTDAIKRILKKPRFQEDDLRTTAEKLTNRKDRVEELLRRVREPNPHPWP